MNSACNIWDPVLYYMIAWYNYNYTLVKYRDGEACEVHNWKIAKNSVQIYPCGRRVRKRGSKGDAPLRWRIHCHSCGTKDQGSKPLDSWLATRRWRRTS